MPTRNCKHSGCHRLALSGHTLCYVHLEKFACYKNANGDRNECALLGCDRLAMRGHGLCGPHREDFEQGFELVWHGGELLPPIRAHA